MRLEKTGIDSQMPDVVVSDAVTHLMLFRETEVVVDPEGRYAEQCRAFVVKVANPCTRASAINAAEMAAYGLEDSMAVSSFTAGLSRKFRENPNDKEVLEHDAFIQEVKAELERIGIK